ncbi:MAG: hypothetical protein HY774_25550 [Acidobacteria bacterium]|nr:hypothetical protein [Acidobacteriota bacterium]
MVLASFTILKESPPTRCEVCHQADCFDPVQLICIRCDHPILQPSLPQNQTWVNLFKFKWVQLVLSNVWFAVYFWTTWERYQKEASGWYLAELVTACSLIISITVGALFSHTKQYTESTLRLLLNIWLTVAAVGLIVFQFHRMKVSLSDPGGSLAWGSYWILSITAIIGTIWTWVSWLRCRVEKKNSLTAGEQ